MPPHSSLTVFTHKPPVNNTNHQSSLQAPHHSSTAGEIHPNIRDIHPALREFKTPVNRMKTLKVPEDDYYYAVTPKTPTPASRGQRKPLSKSQRGTPQTPTRNRMNPTGAGAARRSFMANNTTPTSDPGKDATGRSPRSVAKKRFSVTASPPLFAGSRVPWPPVTPISGRKGWGNSGAMVDNSSPLATQTTLDEEPCEGDEEDVDSTYTSFSNGDLESPIIGGTTDSKQPFTPHIFDNALRGDSSVREINRCNDEITTSTLSPMTFMAREREIIWKSRENPFLRYLDSCDEAYEMARYGRARRRLSKHAKLGNEKGHLFVDRQGERDPTKVDEGSKLLTAESDTNTTVGEWLTAKRLGLPFFTSGSVAATGKESSSEGLHDPHRLALSKKDVNQGLFSPGRRSLSRASSPDLFVYSIKEVEDFPEKNVKNDSYNKAKFGKQPQTKIWKPEGTIEWGQQQERHIIGAEFQYQEAQEGPAECEYLGEPELGQFEVQEQEKQEQKPVPTLLSSRISNTLPLRAIRGLGKAIMPGRTLRESYVALSPNKPLPPPQVTALNGGTAIAQTQITVSKEPIKMEPLAIRTRARQDRAIDHNPPQNQSRTILAAEPANKHLANNLSSPNALTDRMLRRTKSSIAPPVLNVESASVSLSPMCSMGDLRSLKGGRSPATASIMSGSTSGLFTSASNTITGAQLHGSAKIAEGDACSLQFGMELTDDEGGGAVHPDGADVNSVMSNDSPVQWSVSTPFKGLVNGFGSGWLGMSGAFASPAKHPSNVLSIGQGNGPSVMQKGSLAKESLEGVLAKAKMAEEAMIKKGFRVKTKTQDSLLRSKPLPDLRRMPRPPALVGEVAPEAEIAERGARKEGPEFEKEEEDKKIDLIKVNIVEGDTAAMTMMRGLMATGNVRQAKVDTRHFEAGVDIFETESKVDEKMSRSQHQLESEPASFGKRPIRPLQASENRFRSSLALRPTVSTHFHKPTPTPPTEVSRTISPPSFLGSNFIREDVAGVRTLRHTPSMQTLRSDYDAASLGGSGVPVSVAPPRGKLVTQKVALWEEKMAAMKDKEKEMDKGRGVLRETSGRRKNCGGDLGGPSM